MNKSLKNLASIYDIIEDNEIFFSNDTNEKFEFIGFTNIRKGVRLINIKTQEFLDVDLLDFPNQFITIKERRNKKLKNIL